MTAELAVTRWGRATGWPIHAVNILATLMGAHLRARTLLLSSVKRERLVSDVGDTIHLDKDEEPEIVGSPRQAVDEEWIHPGV